MSKCIQNSEYSLKKLAERITIKKVSISLNLGKFLMKGNIEEVSQCAHKSLAGLFVLVCTILTKCLKDHRHI